jgi:hypothetical protein
MDTPSRQAFASEQLTPVLDGASAAPGAFGAPVLPGSFRRGTESLEVVEVLRSWRETGACTHGSSETYVRKHWYEIRTRDGRIARLYFERRPRGRDRRARWWLFSIGPRGSESARVGPQR